MTLLKTELLEQLRAIMGAEATDVSPQACAALERTTLPEATHPLGVVRPLNREQVQKVMRLATEHQLF